MSIIETLTEGIVNRDMKKEGQALLSKWGKTGLLEGLQNEHQKSSMARLLENQAKELLRESSSMAAGDVEGFAAVAFPIVRRVFAGLIANQLVSVQPMSLPSGLIFFLDFVYDETRHGNTADQSLYGTNKVGAGVITGVDLVDSGSRGFSGPGRDGQTGYAYASPTGSNAAVLTAGAVDEAAFVLNGNVSETNAKYIQYDPDLLAITDSGLSVVVLDVKLGEITSSLGAPDLDNLSAFLINVTGGAGFASMNDSDANNSQQVRRLTQKVSANDSLGSQEAIRFVLTTDNVTATTAAACGRVIAANEIDFPLKDVIPAADTVGAVQGTGTLYPLEGKEQIPEINIKVDSTAITAQTKKLKAKWTPELGQDLNAYHNLDAEVELTSILSEQIALEIDREILADLVNGATAGTYYWSRSPGLFVNKLTGQELGATAAAPDFTGTVSEWYETLIETINDVSAQIHRKTLRGGANFVICSPEVANILEFTSGFRANVTADADKGDIGAVKAGSLSRKYDVIVDPYFPRQVILVGRKGNSFLESGYVYAPYVPLQTTPTIFGPEDFVPRKGVMTRYAKKMVRPDMYGLVICRGLLGESGGF